MREASLTEAEGELHSPRHALSIVRGGAIALLIVLLSRLRRFSLVPTVSARERAKGITATTHGRVAAEPIGKTTRSHSSVRQSHVLDMRASRMHIVCRLLVAEEGGVRGSRLLAIHRGVGRSVLFVTVATTSGLRGDHATPHTGVTAVGSGAAAEDIRVATLLGTTRVLSTCTISSVGAATHAAEAAVVATEHWFVG